MEGTRHLRAGRLVPALVALWAIAGTEACHRRGNESAPDGASRDAPASRPEAPETAGPTSALPADDDAPEREAPIVEPAELDAADVDVTSLVRVADERRPISPLIYGMNSMRAEREDPRAMAGVTFVRRGGDRCNTYNWETNVSTGSIETGVTSDLFLASDLENPSAPGELDRVLIARNRAAGRGTMIPFVLNDYVAGPTATEIPYTTPGWDIDFYFRRVELVKPTPFAATPDLSDGVVYTDEHLHFLQTRFAEDIFAPGPLQVMVGTDNEPDLYDYNFPMLQRGTGAPLFASNGVQIGRRVTGTEFTARFIKFAKRVKELAPTAPIVGPDHYHYDGWTTWQDSMHEYSDDGRWFMDDFLEAVRAASEAAGKRLLDTWDFHWYPQRVFRGTFTWALDHDRRPMTDEEIEAVLQGPRSYWDPEYDEHSWVTDDHLHGPAYIVKRLQERIAAGYPGTEIGVTEYFPGGCGHVSSGLATADTLGVFGRLGVHIAAMWPHTCDLRYAFGAFELMRNADGQGRAFAGTSVRVDHPEKAESSVWAASDGADRVTVLVVNKTRAPRRFGLRIAGAHLLEEVTVFRIDADHPSPIVAAREKLSRTNAYVHALPALSAAVFDFRAR